MNWFAAFWAWQVGEGAGRGGDYSTDTSHSPSPVPRRRAAGEARSNAAKAARAVAALEGPGDEGGESGKAGVKGKGGGGGKSSRPWIGILDIFGFEHFELNGFQTFLINTANESIQNTFNHFVFEAELRLFEEEGISLQLGFKGADAGSDEEDAAPGQPSPSGEFVCPDNQACTEALRRILKAIEGVSREPEPSDAKLLRRISQVCPSPGTHARTVARPAAPLRSTPPPPPPWK